MYGSDGNAISPTGIHAGERLHPRFYGTYPRILGRYVREQALMSLETAVEKMTGKPAERLRLKDRGRVEEGLAADLAIFDPDTIIDQATFDNPHQLSEGMIYVLVNGVSVISDGKHTHARPGGVLRRGS
jgi:N-acyl-D-aspartate/D-glutamate deacylase